MEHDKNPIAELPGLVLGACVSPRLKVMQPRDGAFCGNMKTRGKGVPAVSDVEEFHNVDHSKATAIMNPVEWSPGGGWTTTARVPRLPKRT